jgi:GTP-binding protein
MRRPHLLTPMPKVISAEFETSAAEPLGWPEDGPLEIAFVGRSNVGKSSLLNVLASRKGLARTSSEPGRTRLVNFFVLEIEDDAGVRHAVRFVDLPGFGYARVSRSERATWRPAIEQYLTRRRTLRAVVLLVDVRRLGEKADAKVDAETMLDERELHRFIAEHGVRVVVAATKSDKLSKHERSLAAERMQRALGSGAPVLVSSLSGDGRDRLLDKLVRAVSSASPASPKTPGPQGAAS